MTEVEKLWLPAIDRLAPRYRLHTLSDSCYHFSLALAPSDSIHFDALTITFHYPISTYRVEPLRTDHLQDRGTFFIVTDSSYLQWLGRESHGLSDYYGHVHFLLILQNARIDIAAKTLPEVKPVRVC